MEVRLRHTLICSHLNNGSYVSSITVRNNLYPCLFGNCFLIDCCTPYIYIVTLDINQYVCSVCATLIPCYTYTIAILSLSKLLRFVQLVSQERLASSISTANFISDMTPFKTFRGSDICTNTPCSNGNWQGEI